MGYSQRSHSGALDLLVECLPMYSLPNVSLGTNESLYSFQEPTVSEVFL